MQVRVNDYFKKWLVGGWLMSVLVFNASAQAENITALSCEQETINKGWQYLAENRLFFGHQSVGNNIINGLTLLAKKCNKQITFADGSEQQAIEQPIFLHSEIGKNRQPQTKLNEFVTLIDNGLGGKVDLAFMKFCYIDFDKDTDVDALFNEYANALSTLQARYPDTRLISLSAPLTTLKTGPKVWIKNALNGHLSGVSGKLENRKRHQFNTLLRNQYKQSNQLFDLAEVESTLPDGSRETYTLDEQQYYSLYPGYSNDGGHLNEQGQLRVAESFLYYLGGL